MSGVGLRAVVAAIGVVLSLVPLAWRGDLLGETLAAVGVVAAVAASIAGRDALATLVCAAAIGQVAANGRDIPALRVVVIAVLLAGYLAVSEAGSIGRWRLPSAESMRGYVVAPLAGVAAAAALALLAGLPAPGGWLAAVFAVVGCAVGAALVVGAVSALRRSIRERA